jgi:hypothetical protein
MSVQVHSWRGQPLGGSHGGTGAVLRVPVRERELTLAAGHQAGERGELGDGIQILPACEKVRPVRAEYPAMFKFYGVGPGQEEDHDRPGDRVELGERGQEVPVVLRPGLERA